LLFYHPFFKHFGIGGGTLLVDSGFGTKGNFYLSHVFNPKVLNSQFQIFSFWKDWCTQFKVRVNYVFQLYYPINFIGGPPFNLRLTFWDQKQRHQKRACTLIWYRQLFPTFLQFFPLGLRFIVAWTFFITLGSFGW